MSEFRESSGPFKQMYASDVGIAGTFELARLGSALAPSEWSDVWSSSLTSPKSHTKRDLSQNMHPEDPYQREVKYDFLQKRHLIHFIPPDNHPEYSHRSPLELSRPRQRHFDTGDERVYDKWEEPPLLAKEGITSEEASWVPDGQPLKLIKQGYAWGSKAFDLNFDKHPPLTVQTHLQYHPLPLAATPSPTFTSTISNISFRSHFPSTNLSSGTHFPSLNPPLPPSTPPIHAHKNEQYYLPSPSYHPHESPLYSSVQEYHETPRKYYLSEEYSSRPKNLYGLRKYYLNTDLPVPTFSANLADVPLVLENEIEDPNIEQYTPEGIATVEVRKIGTEGVQISNDRLRDLDPQRDTLSNHSKQFSHLKTSQPLLSLPYGYRLQPRHPPHSHNSYALPPYSHYLHQRPNYLLPHSQPYPPPTPGELRKYYLSPREITVPKPPPSSHRRDNETLRIEDNKTTGKELPKGLTPFDVNDMLRSPRSTSSVRWQMGYGRKL
ncbi:hypothetical protein SK128_013233 [Halocaridina rubra]|uniref:Uncharacterized protein n=1 Tax=Halocaridina rubra TaxID=373956 RepID=A0AAN8X247_HALRR